MVHYFFRLWRECMRTISRPCPLARLWDFFTGSAGALLQLFCEQAPSESSLHGKRATACLLCTRPCLWLPLLQQREGNGTLYWLLLLPAGIQLPAAAVISSATWKSCLTAGQQNMTTAVKVMLWHLHRSAHFYNEPKNRKIIALKLLATHHFWLEQSNVVTEHQHQDKSWHIQKRTKADFLLQHILSV